MDPEDRHRIFVRSPHHACLVVIVAIVAIGQPFPFGLVAAALLYGVAWATVPRTPVFQRWADRKSEARLAVPADESRADTLFAHRSLVFSELPEEAQLAYDELEATATEIESAVARHLGAGSVDQVDATMRPIDSLMASALADLGVGKDRSIVREVATALGDTLTSLQSMPGGDGIDDHALPVATRLAPLTGAETGLDPSFDLSSNPRVGFHFGAR